MRRVDPDTAVRLVAAAVRPTGLAWIGVDGFGATGKTTLAAKIAAAVPTASVVHVDDFAHPDIPTWDTERFLREVRDPLLRGEPAHYRVGAWDRGDLAGAAVVTVPARVPVVVEGVSATDDRLGIDWALRLWCSAPRAERLARAMARDGERMRRVWEEEWMPSEEAYARVQRPDLRADLVVRTGW